MSARLEAEILTLFPRMCEGYLAESILGKAREAGLVSVTVSDVREHARGKHRVADDAPYGGGAGMVMKPEPLTEAIEAARSRLPGALVVLTSPRGVRLDQALARRLADARKARHRLRSVRRGGRAGAGGGGHGGLDRRLRPDGRRARGALRRRTPPRGSCRACSATRRPPAQRASRARRRSSSTRSTRGPRSSGG